MHFVGGAAGEAEQWHWRQLPLLALPIYELVYTTDVRHVQNELNIRGKVRDL